MYKSWLLSSTRLFDAEKEGGSGGAVDPRLAAQAERDKIKVDVSKKTEQPEGDKSDDKSDDEGSDEEGEGEGEGDSKEGDDESDGEGDGEEEGEKELTVEEYKKQLEALQKKVNRLERKVGKTAGERDQIKKDLANAKAALDAKVEEGQGLSEEEVERRAELKAGEKATQREFDNAVKTLTQSAIKADKDFMVNVKEMAEDVAPIPPFMIGALEDLEHGNGGAVLAHLANPDNHETYAEIIELSPARMVSRLNKISDKLAEDAKPKPKKISKVPPPIDRLKGNESTPTVIPADPTKNMDQFVRVRAQQVAERKRARGY